MNTLINSSINQSKIVNAGFTLNHLRKIGHPKIIFQKNTLNSTILNNSKRNFSVTPQILNEFVPYGIKKNSKYNVFEGKNPQPIKFKFYYLKPENSDIAAVSLLSSKQINGKGLKKVHKLPQKKKKKKKIYIFKFILILFNILFFLYIFIFNRKVLLDG